MNLFEDLIDELKEDNLLEETIIDKSEVDKIDSTDTDLVVDSDKLSDPDIDVSELADTPPRNNSEEEVTVEAENSLVENVASKQIENKAENVESIYKTNSLDEALVYPEELEEAEHKSESTSEANNPIRETFKEPFNTKDFNFEEPFAEGSKFEESNSELLESNKIVVDESFEKISKTSDEANRDVKPLIINEEPADPETVRPTEKNIENDSEFYRRRAIDEVNGLEMVEHVFSGVQREMLKTIPKNYDSVGVKQALHDFLQVVDNSKSSEHAEAEFALMQETEKWYSALTKKDKEISVKDLRRYCETTKPSLSSQALVALAKFYRNSPYSEKVRSKFDLIITKIFSKDVEDHRRELVFQAEELVKHIQGLYADWSSVPLYSTDEDDSELLLSAIKFQDLIAEAESAESFDELVKKDFFKRLKQFKEKTNENFFAPILVAAGIESNVIIGNRFIDLIEQERNNEEKGSLSNKYGVIHDKSISEATSKTLELLEILKERKSTISKKQSPTAEQVQNKKVTKRSINSRRNRKTSSATSPLLIVVTLITVIVGVVYFLTIGSTSPIGADENISKDVKVVNLENSSLKEYVESARISENTLFAITKPSWSTIGLKEKEEVVGKFLQTGKEKGFTTVQFLDANGETVAFGSENGINVVE